MARQDGFIKTANVTNVRDKVPKWLDGTMALPDFLFIGKSCRNKHGLKGRGVRYISDKCCVVCTLDRSIRAKRKRNAKLVDSAANTAHRNAMDTYERQQENALHDNDLMTMDIG